MQRVMMKSKIHRATVTGSDLNYVGSITIDTDLMRRADLREHEQVHVLDLDNGARFETYVISGGPGDMILNGAAARLISPGDTVIIIAYASMTDEDARSHDPHVVFVDKDNRIVEVGDDGGDVPEGYGLMTSAVTKRSHG